MISPKCLGRVVGRCDSSRAQRDQNHDDCAARPRRASSDARHKHTVHGGSGPAHRVNPYIFGSTDASVGSMSAPAWRAGSGTCWTRPPVRVAPADAELSRRTTAQRRAGNRSGRSVTPGVSQGVELSQFPRDCLPNRLAEPCNRAAARAGTPTEATVDPDFRSESVIYRTVAEAERALPLRRAADDAVSNRVIDRPTADTWLTDLTAASGRGWFVLSVPLFTAVGVKPI